TAGKVSAPQVTETVEKPAAAASEETLSAGRFDIKYLEGPDGRPVYVPDKVSLGEYLEWLEQRHAPVGHSPPGASVSNLIFDGTADDERAYLTAIVDIEVAAENIWVRVPLEMPEGTLRSPAVYSGKGLAVPAPFQHDKGYAWWIRGKGTHQLKLS